MACSFAFGLFSMMIFSSPKIWEDWFWNAAGLIFGIGVSSSVWALMLTVENISGGSHQRKDLILPSLSLLTACGCNQISTLMLDILITEMLIYVLLSRQNSAIKRRVFYYFCVTASASAVCFLAPGNFYRFENRSFESPEISTTWPSLSRNLIRLYQQIAVNIFMMKDYWIFLIIICFLFGTMVTLRNKRRLMLLSIGMLSAGFFSLLPNCVIDYMPSRIYMAAFLWIALAAARLSALSGSLFHDILRDTVLPVRIQSAYAFLVILVSFCPFALLYHENHQLLENIRKAWFYWDEQIRSIPADNEQTRLICGVPVIESNMTDIKFAEAFIANYYGLGGVEDSGVCPPFQPFSEDPAAWR